MQAESGIDRQVSNEPGAIGVVTQQAAVGQLAQGIDRPGPLRTGRQLAGQAVGLFLERHRDIGPAPFSEKCRGTAGKIIERCQQGVVVQLLCRLLGKQAMDQRRLAVANRVTENDVLIHLKPSWSAPLQALLCSTT
ncbi:hypothetical protein D3C81_1790360 [compost metagenome]